MTRRRIVIALHWTTFFGLAALLAAGSTAPFGLVLVFAGAAILWLATYVIYRGPRTRPGPKLVGFAKSFHRVQHHVLYIAAALVGVLCLVNFEAESTGRALKILLFLSLFHGLFHTWRHTALYDGALKMIFPRFMHRHL